jgi:hypothetical protein
MELEAGGVTILLLTVIVALWSLAAAWSNAGELDSLSVFYFGNSLTGNTMPTLHDELGRSAGKRWLVERSQGAGWQVWQHLYLDSRRSHRERLGSGGWHAIFVQPFGSRLFDEMITQMWQGKVSFDEPTNLGDLHCTAGLVELLLQGNPHGRALVYSDWSGMKIEVTRQQNELSKDLEYAERWHQIMEPFRRTFDYEAAWLTEYDEAAAEKVPWKREGVALRIVNDRQDARFYYHDDDGHWRIMQPSVDVSVDTSTPWNLRPALFARGDGQAQFCYFRYRRLESAGELEQQLEGQFRLSQKAGA